MIKRIKALLEGRALLVSLSLFLFSLPISAFLLRQNNLHMVELRNQVIAIDEDSQGDIKKIEPALIELRDYVTTHMNTSFRAPSGEQLPHVALENRHLRVVNELVAEREREDSAYRRSVYNKAQAKCQDSVLSLRVQCIAEYVAAQPGVDDLKLPPVEQFIYEFASPTWSPDAAGFSVLLSIIAGAFGAFYLATNFIAPRLMSMVRDDPLE